MCSVCVCERESECVCVQIHFISSLLQTCIVCGLPRSRYPHGNHAERSCCHGRSSAAHWCVLLYLITLMTTTHTHCSSSSPSRSLPPCSSLPPLYPLSFILYSGSLSLPHFSLSSLVFTLPPPFFPSLSVFLLSLPPSLPPSLSLLSPSSLSLPLSPSLSPSLSLPPSLSLQLAMSLVPSLRRQSTWRPSR